MLPDPPNPAPAPVPRTQASQACRQGGVTPPTQTPSQTAPIRHQDPSLLSDSLVDSSSGHGAFVPPSPTASVASAAGVATTPVATPVATPAAAAPNPARGISAPSATPSECSTVVRHGQFNTAACDEATDDSDPDVSSWHGRGQQQSLQDVLAFLDQKEREVSMIFSKTRTQLLQAMPMPPNTDGSGSAVTARSDEATVRWREFGEPFYRAISLQRQREKENQTLREMVALKKLQLEKLLTALRAGSQPAKAVSPVGPPAETEGSPLSGAVASTPPVITSGCATPARQQPWIPVAQPSGPPPSTPNFPAAPSPSTPNSPIPLDFEYERGPSVASLLATETDSATQSGTSSRGLGSERRLVDDALMIQLASSLSSKADPPSPVPKAVPRESNMHRSDSVSSSSVPMSQMYRPNVDGQGAARR